MHHLCCQPTRCCALPRLPVPAGTASSGPSASGTPAARGERAARGYSQRRGARVAAAAAGTACPPAALFAACRLMMHAEQWVQSYIHTPSLPGVLQRCTLMRKCKMAAPMLTAVPPLPSAATACFPFAPAAAWTPSSCATSVMPRSTMWWLSPSRRLAPAAAGAALAGGSSSSCSRNADSLMAHV